MYDIEEIPNGTLPLKLTTINYYQHEDPGIKAKLISKKYKKNIFRGGRNPINLVTYQEK